MAELARTTLGGTAATTRVAAQVVAADITSGYPLCFSSGPTARQYGNLATADALAGNLGHLGFFV